MVGGGGSIGNLKSSGCHEYDKVNMKTEGNIIH